jgi:hypothetical protein
MLRPLLAVTVLTCAFPVDSFAQVGTHARLHARAAQLFCQFTPAAWAKL